MISIHLLAGLIPIWLFLISPEQEAIAEAQEITNWFGFRWGEKPEELARRTGGKLLKTDVSKINLIKQDQNSERYVFISKRFAKWNDYKIVPTKEMAALNLTTGIYLTFTKKGLAYIEYAVIDTRNSGISGYSLAKGIFTEFCRIYGKPNTYIIGGNNFLIALWKQGNTFVKIKWSVNSTDYKTANRTLKPTRIEIGNKNFYPENGKLDTGKHETIEVNP
ncbi:MAG: hypothetical protein JXA60_02975 [Candidatus Coatesbacteria bacterium]|nr:hypothetical protein [Candidatus Coatesbacteria bacterium]